MNTLLTILAEQQTSTGGGYSGLIMIVAMIAIFYFFMIRPQNKKKKEIEKARKALEVGSKVVTAGGLYGRIKEVRDTTFMVEIAPNVAIKIEKNSVYPVVEASDDKKTDKK